MGKVLEFKVREKPVEVESDKPIPEFTQGDGAVAGMSAADFRALFSDDEIALIKDELDYMDEIERLEEFGALGVVPEPGEES